jgi:nucleoside-diphosphate-sugar epimerase
VAEHRDDVKPISLYHQVNVIGAQNVCDFAEEAGTRTLVFTSTVAVYGFADPGVDETGTLKPFNAYGRSKINAEVIYRNWQAREPTKRSLCIVRPTVVFGEGNRGNVYNLLRQIHFGRFVMIGDGTNCKSMAYVENVAAFLQHALSFSPGVHVYNYVDKPDMDMNTLVQTVMEKLGRGKNVGIRLPYFIGLAGGLACDVVASILGRSFPISAIRVKKFCANTSFGTSIHRIHFVPPVPLELGLQRTVQYEFLENHEDGETFLSE